MKKKISYLFAFVFALSLVGCSEYSVKKISIDKNISNLKNTGIIFRLPDDNIRVGSAEEIANFKNWFSGYEKLQKVSLLDNSSEFLNSYKKNENRFYQTNYNHEFQAYKSLGAINNYLLKNKKELKSLMQESNYDSFVIYEVYFIASVEMQFMDLETVAVVVDKNLNILYRDKQFDRFELSGFTFDDVRMQVLDKSSYRLIELLQNLKFIVEK